MKPEKLDKLNEYLDALCKEYVFDDIDYDDFNSILARAQKDINYICEVTTRQLQKEFGDFNLTNKE